MTLSWVWPAPPPTLPWLRWRAWSHRALYLVLPVAQLVQQNELFYYFYLMFLPMFALINLYLMFFNLLPIPPLDGSSIFAFFLPPKYLPKYYKVQQYALPVFLVVVLLLPYVLHFNPMGFISTPQPAR